MTCMFLPLTVLLRGDGSVCSPAAPWSLRNLARAGLRWRSALPWLTGELVTHLQRRDVCSAPLLSAGPTTRPKSCCTRSLMFRDVWQSNGSRVMAHLSHRWRDTANICSTAVQQMIQRRLITIHDGWTSSFVDTSVSALVVVETSFLCNSPANAGHQQTGQSLLSDDVHIQLKCAMIGF